MVLVLGALGVLAARGALQDFEFLDISFAGDIQSKTNRTIRIFEEARANLHHFRRIRRWPRATVEKDSRDRTVLIVEDSDDARYFMRLSLEQLGYLVIEADNGARAVEIAQLERPDMILMDLSLPILDGLAATEKIRATDGLSTVPIIAVTAHQEIDFRTGAKAAGFDAYVTKPIDIDFLGELIKGLLV